MSNFKYELLASSSLSTVGNGTKYPLLPVHNSLSGAMAMNDLSKANSLNDFSESPALASMELKSKTKANRDFFISDCTVFSPLANRRPNLIDGEFSLLTT
jgi:hypothetical protein